MSFLYCCVACGTPTGKGVMFCGWCMPDLIDWEYAYSLPLECIDGPKAGERVTLDGEMTAVRFPVMPDPLIAIYSRDSDVITPTTFRVVTYRVVKMAHAPDFGCEGPTIYRYALALMGVNSHE